MPNTQVVAERVNGHLRKLFPRDTAKQVSAATGLPPGTIAKWLARSSAPSAAALLTLFAVFGPELLSAVYPGLGWVETAIKLTRRDALAQALDRADAEAAEALQLLRGRR